MVDCRLCRDGCQFVDFKTGRLLPSNPIVLFNRFTLIPIAPSTALSSPTIINANTTLSVSVPCPAALILAAQPFTTALLASHSSSRTLTQMKNMNAVSARAAEMVRTCRDGRNVGNCIFRCIAIVVERDPLSCGCYPFASVPIITSPSPTLSPAPLPLSLPLPPARPSARHRENRTQELTSLPEASVSRTRSAARSVVSFYHSTSHSDVFQTRFASGSAERSTIRQARPSLPQRCCGELISLAVYCTVQPDVVNIAIPWPSSAPVGLEALLYSGPRIRWTSLRKSLTPD